MIQSGENWAKECNRKGPLAGIPVSLKDTTGVAGWDSAIGYSAWVGKPLQKDSTLVRLLRDAGAVPYVKTNVPITLMSGETWSDLFGRTTNPHKKTHSPGGSTGGEAALLAFGGSRIGVGTDVAGSVRIPAHFSGVYSIKASVGRFPRTGNTTSIAGQEGVPAVYSPMARTLGDLETFWKAICLVMPWRDFDTKQPLKWGVMWDDGTRDSFVVALLGQTSNPPSPYEGLKIGAQLLVADGGRTAMKPFRSGESNDAGVAQVLRMLSLPRWAKRLYVCARTWPVVAQREDYRRRWFEMLQKEQLDFVLTVPNPLPAIPHNGMKDGCKALGYTLLFNLLDYTAGVLPVTHVDAVKDKLSDFKPRSTIEKDTFKLYDSVAMDGLPIGVQVVGKRLEEEKVLAGMKIVEQLLMEDGKAYGLFNA
ncbi:hypothetical protein H0H81_001267 [Sphagnurus paluster]|uniref:Amidase domain-containing protein n=1 Tax=Sphagnurus paluster TaxID=117069 RepID=A0A9P7GUR3_9AGAR|nr:hypothetical protein H0H81_001267 [Sphagnurus paluster]